MTKIELIFFSGSKCGVCHAIQPKLEELLNQQFPNTDFTVMDIVKEPELASEYMVFTAPVLLLLVDGKEHYRFKHSFSIYEVEEKLIRLQKLL